MHEVSGRHTATLTKIHAAHQFPGVFGKPGAPPQSRHLTTVQKEAESPGRAEPKPCWQPGAILGAAPCCTFGAVPPTEPPPDWRITDAFSTHQSVSVWVLTRPPSSSYSRACKVFKNSNNTNNLPFFPPRLVAEIA